MAYQDRPNPFKYKAHYDAKVKGMYAPLTYTVEIIQPDNGVISVLFNGISYTESFTVQKGQVIRPRISTSPGYLVDTFTINGQPVVADKEYTVEENLTFEATTKIQSFSVQIKNNAYATITATLNGKANTGSFYATYNDLIIIDAASIDGYDVTGLNLNGEDIHTQLPYEYRVTQDTVLEVFTDISRIDINITQPDNGEIVVTHNGNNYRDHFIVEYGDEITVKTSCDEGYHLTELVANKEIISDGYTYEVFEDQNISAVISINVYHVTMQHPANGRLSANTNGYNYDNSFNINHGDSASFVCLVDDEESYYLRALYLNGEEITQNVKYPITRNSIASADVAEVEVVETVTIRINQTTGATIYASYNNNIYSDTFVANKDYPVTIWVEPLEMYNITGFTLSGSNSGVQNLPEYDRYVFTANENKIVGCQTQLKVYRVHLKNVTGGTLRVTMDGKDYTSDFDIIWGHQITIHVDLNIAYNLTSVTLDGVQVAEGSTHTITAEATITFTTALKRYQIQVVQPANGKITVNGTVGTSFTFTHGTQITVAATPNSGYKLKSFTKTDL